MEYSLESAILYREVWSRYATFILRGLFCLRLHYTQEYSRRGLISAASPRALERTLILPFCLINILQCSKSWVLTNLEHVYRSEIRNDFNLKKKKKKITLRLSFTQNSSWDGNMYSKFSVQCSLRHRQFLHVRNT